MPVSVIISFQVKPEMLNAFMEIMGSVKRDLPTVNGCKSVAIYRNSAEEHAFTLVEQWESEALHKKHIAGVVNSGGWEHIASHLQCEPVSAYFSQF